MPCAGVYSFTVVTGLYDIGRGKWLKQSRTYNQYLKYLLQVGPLPLDIGDFNTNNSNNNNNILYSSQLESVFHLVH